MVIARRYGYNAIHRHSNGSYWLYNIPITGVDTVAAIEIAIVDRSRPAEPKPRRKWQFWRRTGNAQSTNAPESQEYTTPWFDTAPQLYICLRAGKENECPGCYFSRQRPSVVIEDKWRGLCGRKYHDVPLTPCEVTVIDGQDGKCRQSLEATTPNDAVLRAQWRRESESGSTNMSYKIWRWLNDT